MLSHASEEARGRRLSTLGVYRAPAAAHVVSQRNFADLRADSAGLATSVAATTLSRIAAWPTGMAPLRPVRPFDTKEASALQEASVDSRSVLRGEGSWLPFFEVLHLQDL